MPFAKGNWRLQRTRAKRQRSSFMLWLHRSHKVISSSPSKLCDIYGPLPLCKVIIEGDKKRLSCGRIYGFVGKNRAFPALMDSARARLNGTSASKRPRRKTGSEHVGLTLDVITSFSPSQLSASIEYRCHSGGLPPPLARASSYTALRYSASVVNSAQAMRAFLLAALSTSWEACEVVV